MPYGVLTCQNGDAGGIRLQSVLFEDPDGNGYAVNGTAQSHTDLPAIDPVWADNPDIDGAKIDIGPLINRGLGLC